jgi:hypothetical protein
MRSLRRTATEEERASDPTSSTSRSGFAVPWDQLACSDLSADDM